MSDTNLNVNPATIEEVYDDSFYFYVPDFQRNYAWKSNPKEDAGVDDEHRSPSVDQQVHHSRPLFWPSNWKPVTSAQPNQTPQQTAKHNTDD